MHHTKLIDLLVPLLLLASETLREKQWRMVSYKCLIMLLGAMHCGERFCTGWDRRDGWV